MTSIRSLASQTSTRRIRQHERKNLIPRAHMTNPSGTESSRISPTVAPLNREMSVLFQRSSRSESSHDTCQIVITCELDRDSPLLGPPRHLDPCVKCIRKSR